MGDIKAKLADRLTAKGLENNETELFIKDVIRFVTSSPGFDIDTINENLHLLIWRDDCVHIGIIEPIQACYHD